MRGAFLELEGYIVRFVKFVVLVKKKNIDKSRLDLRGVQL